MTWFSCLFLSMAIMGAIHIFKLLYKLVYFILKFLGAGIAYIFDFVNKSVDVKKA